LEKSHEVVEGEVVITSKRSRGELVSQADEVQVLEAPRGKSKHLCLTLQLM
jgi:hypothetical protein